MVAKAFHSHHLHRRLKQLSVGLRPLVRNLFFIFYGIHYNGEIFMKFLRKILDVSGEYGQVSLPKPIFDSWFCAGFTHVEMIFDEENNTLVICPI